MVLAQKELCGRNVSATFRVKRMRAFMEGSSSQEVE